jgi:hypothetical protein
VSSREIKSADLMNETETERKWENSGVFNTFCVDKRRALREERREDRRKERGV